MNKEKKSVYGSYSLTKINAPVKNKSEDPKSSRIEGKSDLRGGRK